MKIPSFFLLFLFLISGVCRAQPIDFKLSERLQIVLDSMAMANNIKGISACVIYPGQGSWQGVTGISHDGVPISSGMLFGIASNTKLFSGVIALKLASAGLISLDDSLHRWLSAFKNVDSNITIRQILHHTSGLADVNNVPGYADSVLSNPTRMYSPSEVMTWVGAPLFSAGKGWDYCNTNYILAGMVVESASGQSFGKLLRDSILSPLQLDSTFLDVYENVNGTIAHPWQGGLDRIGTPRKALNSVAWAAGAMYSTAGEMAHWYWNLMNGRVLSPSAYKEMTTFVGSGNYGVGLYRTTIFNRPVWHHGGTIWGGYNSSMMYDTASKIVISVFINQNPAQAFLVAKQLLYEAINYMPPTTSIIQREKIEMILYPNPVTDRIVLTPAINTPVKIKIRDMQGKLMGVYDVTDFSVAHLPAGVYILESQNSGLTQLMKFVKL